MSGEGEPTSVADLRYTCPVCLDSLFPPVFQCHNGHLMCQSCSSRLENCGVCRANLPQVDKIRCLEVERIIRMIQHPCPNEMEGCHAKVNFKQLEAHRVECVYTKFPICQQILGKNCQKIRICDFEEHYERTHSKKVLQAREADTLPVTKTVRTGIMDRSSDRHTIIFKFYFDKKPTLLIVVVALDSARDLLTWRPYVLAGRAVASQLHCKFSILSGQHVKVTLESPIFNVETELQEVQAFAGLPYKYVQTIFTSSTANDKGNDRYRIDLWKSTQNPLNA